MMLPQRSFRRIPISVLGLLLLSLTAQVLWHQRLPPLPGAIQSLPQPPSIEQLRVFSFGEPVASAKLLMLWLQSFDNQGGKFLSYRQLDYTTLAQWLERILQLDSRSQYPLLVASQVYSTIPDPQRMRIMLELVYQKFFENPHQRWPWLSQAAVLAKHRLKDLPLALKYAQAIAAHATVDMPLWAKEMRIFILEDLGELEQVRLIIGGLLASGQIKEPNEIKFLDTKLRELEKKPAEMAQPPP